MAENKAAGFETSLERLEAIVRALESDQTSLDDSVKLFKEGRDLARHCESLLKAAQDTIEAVASGAPEQATSAKPPPAPINPGSLFDDDEIPL